MRRLLFCCLLMVMTCGLTAAASAAEPTLPVLDWTPRSDWINVKTDVTPAAVGDGQADDTKALQAAFEKAGVNGVIYMPPGTYRITDTLESWRKKRSAVAWIGCGRNTRIVWDGPADKPMFIDHGFHRSRFMGFIFDGKNKASTGFVYAGDAGFGTRLRFKDMGFVNLKFGIRSGSRKKWHGEAAAEVAYENCLFMNCSGGGVVLTLQNYFDNIFSGCEFRDNGTGIYLKFAQGYIYDSHFQNNKRDIYAAGEHGISVRRCTSEGSDQFIVQNRVDPMTIQDCAVSGWGEKGAITINGGWRAPTLIFDCTFKKTGQSDSAAIVMTNQKSQRRRIVLSNNKTLDGATLISGGQGEAHRVPAGQRDGSINAASRVFLKSQVDLPGVSPSKIFDVKKDFGAVGDGKADDTKAIQQAIDAAKAQGRGALVYLPKGWYRVTKPIVITGSDYVVGGTLSIHSRIIWGGPLDAPAVVLVRDPHNVTLQHLQIGSGARKAAWITKVPAVKQVGTGTGRPTSMHYDEIQAPGLYWTKATRPAGFQLVGLGPKDVVDIGVLAGETRVVDSGRANILIDYHFAGAIHVAGDKAKTRDGFLGIQFMLQTLGTGYAIDVRNNQSLVVSDLYFEQTADFVSLSGQPGEPAGQVTISGPKAVNHYNAANEPVIKIDNYKGLFSWGPQQFYGFWDWPKEGAGVHPRIKQTGDRPVDIVVMATLCFPYKMVHTPVLELEPAARLTMIANNWHDAVVPEKVGLKPVSRALDQLRELGAWDLRLNHPTKK